MKVPETAAASGGRGFARSASVLSGGVGIAGLLTYGFFSLASHNLDATAYGEIVVLWSAVFVTISVLHRPVEQYLSRAVAERHAHGETSGREVRTAASLQGTVALVFALAALVAREPLEDELLSGNATLYWVYVSAVLAFAVSFFARGYLAGDGSFGLLAGLLVSESLARTAFALALALGIASGQDAVALGIVAAPIFSLLVVPLALAHRATARTRRRSRPGAGELARGGAFAGAVFVIMLAEQTFLSAGPLLLRAVEGAAAAGFIFNVLMLARAPLLVFQGVAISLLPHLTRLRSRGDADSRASFELSVDQTLRAIFAFTLLVAAIVAAAGPALMQAAFGEQFDYDRAGLLLVTAAMGFYLCATTLNQAALAEGRARRAAAAWLGAAVVFLAWCLVPVIDDAARRVEIGFVAGAALLAAALWRIYRAVPSAADVPVVPGSAEEIEARLALADEAS